MPILYLASEQLSIENYFIILGITILIALASKPIINRFKSL